MPEGCDRHSPVGSAWVRRRVGTFPPPELPDPVETSAVSNAYRLALVAVLSLLAIGMIVILADSGDDGEVTAPVQSSTGSTTATTGASATVLGPTTDVDDDDIDTRTGDSAATTTTDDTSTTTGVTASTTTTSAPAVTTSTTAPTPTTNAAAPTTTGGTGGSGATGGTIPDANADGLADTGGTVPAAAIVVVTLSALALGRARRIVAEVS